MPDPLQSKIDASALGGSLERRQRNRMVLAVLLLLVAIVVVVLKDRHTAARHVAHSAVNVVPARPAPVPMLPSETAANHHAVPATPDPFVQQAALQQNNPSSTGANQANPATTQPTTRHTTPHKSPQSANRTPSSSPATSPVTPSVPKNDAGGAIPGVTTTRAVLPPLRVEVVAGDRHSPVKPGDPSLKVDMQPFTPARPEQQTGAAASSPGDDAPLTDATERVQVSADTAQVLTHKVRPEYPLLARQMKVQGSVVLDAMIGKDGGIQDLHVVQGPTILADAAREAVRQWRFKPYMQAGQPVETQAHITVNFMISTN